MQTQPRSLGPVWDCERSESRVVAAAIHNGHEVRPEVEALLALGEEDRRREEDPLTSLWTQLEATKIRVLRSRFEVDLNRPRERAVYLDRDDAWGLRVWKCAMPKDVIDRSLAEYDDFYRFVGQLLDELTAAHGKIVVFDIHSYNHRRRGPHAPPADASRNPEINVGTGALERAYWAPVIDRFITELRGHDLDGRHLDVRENVKFEGGHFPRWIHARHPEKICTLSVEVKKFFMDEWEGTADIAKLESIRMAVQATLRGVGEAVEAVG